MGCNIAIKAIRDLDVDFKEMITIAKMCKKKNISLPKEVIEYFKPLEEDYDSIEDMDEIDEKSIGKLMGEVHIEYGLGEKIKGLVSGDRETEDGLVIDLTKLPKEFKKIRVYMSC
jgi:hypothetical protein